MNKKIIWALILTLVMLIATIIYKNFYPGTDASSWKTYTSNKYGFTFQYPSNWSISPTYASGGDIDPESSLLISSPETKKLIDSRPHENIQNYDLVVSVHTGVLPVQSDTFKITDAVLDGRKIKKYWSVGPDAGPFEGVLYADNGTYVLFSYPRNEIETQIVLSFATSSMIQKTGN